MITAKNTIYQLASSIKNLLDSLQPISYDKLTTLVGCIIRVGEDVVVREDDGTTKVKSYQVKQEHDARIKSVTEGRVQMEQTSWTSSGSEGNFYARQVKEQHTHSSATYYIETDEFLEKIGFTYKVKSPDLHSQTINVEIQYKLTTPPLLPNA